MDNPNLELITIEDFCDALQIGKNSAYKLLASGKVKCFSHSRAWKIPRASLDQFILEQSHLI